MYSISPFQFPNLSLEPIFPSLEVVRVYVKPIFSFIFSRRSILNPSYCGLPSVWFAIFTQNGESYKTTIFLAGIFNILATLSRANKQFSVEGIAVG